MARRNTLVLALSILCGAVVASPLGDRGSLLSSMGISSWSHPADHPVHDMFKRQTNSALQIGSEDWIAQYPTASPDETDIPAAWLAVLRNAESAGLIPNISLSDEGVYPRGTRPGSPEVCSSAAECRGDGDIWDAPDGMLGVSFDDGPTEFSHVLYDFLKTNNQRATHFMIGMNIRDNWEAFQQTFNDGNDIASHTWSHQFMTGLTNEEAFAELAWTCQIISDMTGGRLPRYWRPPYGDSDNRIRAIAKLFGLTQVNWNRDTEDWELKNHKVTQSGINRRLRQWLNGPKSPGLLILEHELDNGTIRTFTDIYPVMKSTGWDVRSIPQLNNTGFYLNAADNSGSVIPMTLLGTPPSGLPGSTTEATAQPSDSASTSNTSTQQNSGSLRQTYTTSAMQVFGISFVTFSAQYLLSS